MPAMTTAHDVVAFIRQRSTSTLGRMQEQKLLYYAQAWSLVWDGRPLFHESILKWKKGPVVREVYNNPHGGDASRLDPEQRATVCGVLEFYGGLAGHKLSDLTHRELPWRSARHNGEIAPEQLAVFYGGSDELRNCGKVLPDVYRKSILSLLTMDDDHIDALYASLDDHEDTVEIDPEWLSA